MNHYTKQEVLVVATAIGLFFLMSAITAGPLLSLIAMGVSTTVLAGVWGLFSLAEKLFPAKVDHKRLDRGYSDEDMREVEESIKDLV